MRRFIAACLLAVSLLGGSFLNFQTVAADLNVAELPFGPNSSAWEIHADAQGRVWVSDYGAGELWRVDADGGKYQVFAVGGSPSDAYPDAGGNAWWVDGTTLNRLNSASGAVNSWSLPGGSTLVGVEIDAQGKIWTNNGIGRKLFRLDPANNQLCSYALNHNAQSYPAISGGMVWVADTSSAYLVRLDPGTNTVTWWDLPSYTSAYDLSPDEAGNIWYTDSNSYQFGGLGRLNPSSNQLTEFSLPAGRGTNMLTVSQGKIWYTESYQGTFGSFDPAQASASPFLTNHGTDNVTPVCAGNSPVNKPAVTGQTNDAHWTTAPYTSLADSGGWAVYQIPAGTMPKGIAIASTGWVVDLGRQMLLNFSVGNVIFPSPSPTVPPSTTTTPRPPGKHKTFIPMLRR